MRASRTVPGGVSAVLYGGRESLPKRRQIKERIEQQHTGLEIRLLDDLAIPSLIGTVERAYAREAVANIFLIDPSWQSYGALHELTTLIEVRTLATVAVIHPEHDQGNGEFTILAGREAMEAIPDQCHSYGVESWGDCSEITYICDRALRARWRLQQLFPNRAEPPPLLDP
ncbi:MAG: hypothetical protein OXG61_11215 [Chloroflexi bacterium]|nr:hypothetical protein [Chloroflexota bacterium]